MLSILLIVLLMVLLFGALGLAVSPWFFVLLVAALVLAASGSYGGYRGRM